MNVIACNELRIVESYAVAMPDETMSWVCAIKNNDDRDLWTGVGAICAGESGDQESQRDIDLDIDLERRNGQLNDVINKVIVIRENGYDGRREGGAQPEQQEKTSTSR